MGLFRKRDYTKVRLKKKNEIPHGLWKKCPDCGEIIFNEKFEEFNKICPKCRYHFTLTARERIDLIADRGSFRELYHSITNKDPLAFEGPKTYKDKVASDKKKTQSKTKPQPVKKTKSIASKTKKTKKVSKK